MIAQLPYCGAPPFPHTLLSRFNLDPILIGVLGIAIVTHLWLLRRRGGQYIAGAGWAITTLALISPLCALSVSLFCARVGQHMILVLCAAPLLALATPPLSLRWARASLWLATFAFFVALWLWHMPVPYDATFEHTTLYWTMHVTLFGSAVALWRALLRSPRQVVGDVLLAGAVTSMQMGFLGAVLTTASRALFFPHLATTQIWGLTPLHDQQLGGVLMWVPGIALFLWAALYALGRLRTLTGGVKPA